MEMKIGARIADLRRQRGMTQEQLAAAVGVSAPAVSKWETNRSYPDIVMLCPLARALGTNVDMLLAYEENLSKEKIPEYLNKIIETRRIHGTAQAEAELTELLNQYPNSIPLKCQAAAVFTSFEMMDADSTDQDKERWKRKKKELMTAVYESGDSEYMQTAVCALAALAMQENDLDRAEVFLKELPEIQEDVTGLRVKLYMKKGEKQKAQEMVRKRIFTLAVQMLTCLTILIESAQDDTEKSLELCGFYRKLEEIIYTEGGMGSLIYAQCFGRAGRDREAEESLISYLDGPEGPRVNPLLYEPPVRPARGRMSKEMREMMIQSILTDDILSRYCETEEVKQAVQRYLSR